MQYLFRFPPFNRWWPGDPLCFATAGEEAAPERLDQGSIAVDIGLVGGGIGHIDFCDDIHRRFRLRTDALDCHGTKSRASEYRQTQCVDRFHNPLLCLSSLNANPSSAAGYTDSAAQFGAPRKCGG